MRKHLQHYGYYSDRNALVRHNFNDGPSDCPIAHDTSDSSSDTSEDEHDEKTPLQYKGIISLIFNIYFELSFLNSYIYYIGSSPPPAYLSPPQGNIRIFLVVNLENYSLYFIHICSLFTITTPTALF